MDEFEAEIQKILDEKFIEKAKNLKKSGHIFNPVFYLFFTRLVELSAIFRNIVMPNRYELEELFSMRKDFLQIDYKTLNEILRRAWVYERAKGTEFSFSKSADDMLYLLYRMGRIQKEIDDAILKHAEWKKESLVEIYFTLLRIFLEIEEKVNKMILEESKS
ncbi:MAG: hypothetical protein QXN34_05530 [Archaeoglobaceae archaeon]